MFVFVFVFVCLSLCAVWVGGSACPTSLISSLSLLYIGGRKDSRHHYYCSRYVVVLCICVCVWSVCKSVIFRNVVYNNDTYTLHRRRPFSSVAIRFNDKPQLVTFIGKIERERESVCVCVCVCFL